jgi:hypothetical protein
MCSSGHSVLFSRLDTTKHPISLILSAMYVTVQSKKGIQRVIFHCCEGNLSAGQTRRSGRHLLKAGVQIDLALPFGPDGSPPFSVWRLFSAT